MFQKTVLFTHNTRPTTEMNGNAGFWFFYFQFLFNFNHINRVYVVQWFMQKSLIHYQSELKVETAKAYKSIEVVI